jgi:hypothetical protein
MMDIIVLRIAGNRLLTTNIECGGAREGPDVEGKEEWNWETIREGNLSSCEFISEQERAPWAIPTIGASRRCK